MKPMPFIQTAIFTGAMFAQSFALAMPLDQLSRWVTVDNVLVRSGPSTGESVAGKLNRGAELTLKTLDEDHSYCFVEGEGVFGYVACKYLSAEPVARAKAGENGIDAAQRWIGGNAVVVREAPRQDAAIAGRLSLNTVVKLVGNDSAAGYCEIGSADGMHGYTACRYLSQTPVVLAHVRGLRMSDRESPSQDYDPVRAFWLDPSWEALEAYATHLKESHPEIPPQGPWPRDDELERMKAHLALGLSGVKPKPYGDWASIQKTATQTLAMQQAALRSPNEGKPDTKAVRQIPVDMLYAVSKLQQDAGPSVYFPQAPSSDNPEATMRLIQALDFLPVQPSLFRNYVDVAPPSSTAADASGRFGIVFRQVVTPRRPKPDQNDPSLGAGLYDMLAHTQSLTRPVHYVRLFRDGRIKVESSFVRNTETLWRDTDEPECAGWTPGFAYGSAAPGNSQFFTANAAESTDKGNPNPAGSVYAFYTTVDLPKDHAVASSSAMKLDRQATGFVGGTYLLYDLDGDGIPDLAIWEGKGLGVGDVMGLPNGDDPWYRLVLVNINGAWKMLGSDEFGYGCGC